MEHPSQGNHVPRDVIPLAPPTDPISTGTILPNQSSSTRARPFLFRFLVIAFSSVLLIAGCSGIVLFAWYQSHLRSARHSVFLGHNLASIRHLNYCRQIRPENPELLLLCARVARRAGNWMEAEDLLDQVWKQQGDSDGLVLERILLRASRGELDQTLPVLASRIQLQSPESFLAREAIIFGLLYRFRLQEADRHIESWLEAEPGRAMAWLQKGRREELRDATADAILAFQKALDLDPEYDEAALRLLPLLLQEYKLEEAASVLESFRDRLGSHPEMQTHTAHLLRLQGKTNEAGAFLDQALGLHPNDPGLLTERGIVALRNNEFSEAEGFLLQAIRVDPGSLTARYHLIMVLNQQGKKAEAEQQGQKASQLEADLKNIQQLLNTQLQKGQPDAATFFEVAMIAQRSGQPREALRWLLSAIQTDPNHVPTHRALAVFYRETGNPILSARHRALAQKLSAASTP